jgi:hypothetical protein
LKEIEVDEGSYLCFQGDVEVQASGNSIENFEGTVLSIKHIKKSTPCLMILP